MERGGVDPASSSFEAAASIGCSATNGLSAGTRDADLRPMVTQGRNDPSSYEPFERFALAHESRHAIGRLIASLDQNPAAVVGCFEQLE